MYDRISEAWPGVNFSPWLLALSDLQILVIVAGLILLLLAVVVIVARFDRREEARIREVVMPEIAARLGSLVSVGDGAFQFERDGTVFSARYESIVVARSQKFKAVEWDFEVRFDLPGQGEKFFIQHRSAFAKNASDCQPISVKGIPEDFIFHSLHPHFLIELLKRKSIRDEINRYPCSWWNRLRITFDSGAFVMTWRCSGKAAMNKGENLYQMCRTAAIFFEELREMQALLLVPDRGAATE